MTSVGGSWPSNHGSTCSSITPASGGGPDDHKRLLRQDGIEPRFAVNYLAPFLLTHLLVPMLKASAPSRIVNVASVGQEAVDFDDVMLERGFDAFAPTARASSS